jgi:low affinity Fe/Cu permease
MKIRDTFSSISRKAAEISGSWQASILAIACVIVWTIGGFVFGFTDTYQLIINTGTTIVTFVMVFLIQSAQNRDTKAMNLKLDDLLSSIRKADDKLINIENSTDDEITEAKNKIKPEGTS